MTDVVLIARCPEHGLHGERDECFVCGGPVEQVPMIPAGGGGAVATTYTVNLDAQMHDWITVVLTCRAGGGPHRPPFDTWAVRRGACCLNADGEWEYEPLPSSRDAAFLARTRWRLEEALRRAEAVAHG